MFGASIEEENRYDEDEDIAPSKKRQKKEAFKKARLQKALLAAAVTSGGWTFVWLAVRGPPKRL